MKWFSEKNRYHSNRNGIINVRRILGEWGVSVDGCGHTTEYTNAMWKDAFKRLAKKGTRVQSVLMLGLGAAGGISYLHKSFPECQVTAIEYDSEMITIV